MYSSLYCDNLLTPYATGFGEELRLVPGFLRTQNEIKDLLRELVEAQKTNAEVQREKVEVAKDAAKAQQATTNAIMTLAQACAGHHRM